MPSLNSVRCPAQPSGAKTFGAYGLAALMIATSLPPLVAKPANAGESLDPVAACRTTDEQSFRTAIEAVTVRALEKGLSTVDYAAAVDDEWRRLGLGAIIDKEVDLAVEAVKNETSWGALIQSLGDEETAKKLTIAVAERVYRSEPVKKGIEDLAGGIGRSLGQRIEIATEDAARPAIRCLEAFLGPRYGSTVATVVTGTAGQEFTVSGAAGGGAIGTGDVIANSGEGLTGAAILIMRRQLANMAGRIGARIAGSVLTRLVSVVAGGIGLVLIAKDVWDLRNGVLPIIASEMKSDDTKAKVKAELAKSLSEQIGVHVKELGAHAADRIVAIWREFQAQHVKVLDLAERHANFRAFLDKVEPNRLARLGEATSLTLGAEGEDGVLKRLSDGSLDEAVNKLGDPAFDIARQTRSLPEALAWNGVAGDLIGQVLSTGIFQKSKPGDFTRSALEKLLALDDPVAIGRLAAAGTAAREIVLSLPPSEAKAAAQTLTSDQLATLATYLGSLPAASRDAILGAIRERPERLDALTKVSVRDAVLASADRQAAVSIMLRRDSEIDGDTLLADLRQVYDGKVDVRILWERHPFVIGAAIGLAAILLLLVLRLLWPRPRPRMSAAAG